MSIPASVDFTRCGAPTEIIQPLRLLLQPSSLAAAIGLGEFLVPIMLLDCDDRTKAVF